MSERSERARVRAGTDSERSVRIIAAVHHDLEVSVATSNNTKPAPVLDIELIPQAHTGQLHLFDVPKIDPQRHARFKGAQGIK